MLTLDDNQIIVQKKLQQLAMDLKKQSSLGFFQKVLSGKSNLKSLYIYGDVGRGKSMLMKEFYNSIKEIDKIYFHFNAFMQLIHESLRDIRKEEKKYKDELIEAVKRVVKKSEIICFDEFQVLDIADAMLLSRIFSYLFSQEKLIIFTSNSNPRDLYKNGLQREVFLEFIDKILLKNCEVLYLNSPIDYRALYRKSLTKRYFISNQKNRLEIKKIIANLLEKKKLKSKKLKVWGREVVIKKTCENIAVINFDDICRLDFSAADYREIAKNFDLIFLLKVPKLSKEDVNEARRFILFIDEIYENNVALIILSQTKAEKIYENGIGAEAFKRTVSRLNEIKSDDYWLKSKINIFK